MQGYLRIPLWRFGPPDSQICGCCLVEKVCGIPVTLDRTSSSALPMQQFSFEAVLSPWHCSRSIATARVSAVQNMLHSEERASGATSKIDRSLPYPLFYELGDRLGRGRRCSAHLRHHPPAALPSRNKQPKQPASHGRLTFQPLSSFIGLVSNASQHPRNSNHTTPYPDHLASGFILST